MPSVVPDLSLEERLALALAEDCFTALDEADIGHVIEAVLPVARRYASKGSRLEQLRSALTDLLDATGPDHCYDDCDLCKAWNRAKGVVRDAN